MQRRKPKVYPLDKADSIRGSVLDRLEEFGVNKSDLAHHGGCDAAPSTVFRFLSGERDTFSGNVEQILSACGLRLVATSNVPAGVKSL